ncbi:LysR family transcriptional regulator [Aeromicrobium sp. CTD01-1L150]|uniref:LysR family transcriptional regulator n=1 Tax=Aeromicrobium sp. CTD01-1L150 TaxID=3341830 RepID=UPI0035C1ECAE
MDVRRLGILRELGERGSVGATADAMKITPSAVSQQLKTLEREAGYRLVEPAGRGVVLTEAGRALARTATEIATAIERAEGAWREFMAQPAGRVTLTTFPTGAEMLLPGVLTRVADLTAGVVGRPGPGTPGGVVGRPGPGTPALELECSDVEVTGDYGELTTDHDVVVSDTPATSSTWHERGLQVVPLMTEPLDVAVPQDHPLAARRTLSPKDVADEPWIGVPQGQPFDQVLEKVVAATGEPVRVVQRFANNGVVEAMVAGGHGLAILPRFTTRVHSNGLVTKPLTGVRAQREISALLRPDRYERPSVRLVLEALQAEAQAVADAHGAA